MMQNQKDTINHAIGKFMALGFLNPDDIDSQMIAAAKPIEELVDGLNAEVESLDQEVKTLTKDRERLNKALEQAVRYEEWVYSDEKRCPELAAWLKENRS